MEDDRQLDGEIADTLIEVKAGVNALAHLRAGILQLVYALDAQPGKRGLLVLANSRITEERFNEERNRVCRVFRPEISNRLVMSTYVEGAFGTLPPWFGLVETDRLKAIVRQEVGENRNRLPRPDYAYEIFKVLLLRWFEGAGPLTVKDLAETIGCTYPTVAKVLEQMEPDLRRTSSRQVELDRFPKQQWTSYVLQGAKVRQTFAFVDRSGDPRSAESLLRRISRQRAKVGSLAMGGIVGVRHLFPSIDLLGTPRVDLTLHCPGNHLDLGFVKRIDPGLKSTTSADEVPALVIHLLRRRQSFFREGGELGGLPVADPVECLFDLQEARLESQAEEFLEALRKRNRSR